MQKETVLTTQTTCFHCGDECGSKPVLAAEKIFCCDGCKMVYEILNQNGLCNYYDISQNPGINRKIKVRENKFSFLDDEGIVQSLISFKNDTQTHVTLYLPQMHCSSCLWLLENLHRLDAGIVSSKVNFVKKEAAIVYQHKETSLKKVAELLTSIGYEPYISLHNLSERKSFVDKSKIYKLGVAGFCFANIMMLSFPEYLGLSSNEHQLQVVFRWISVMLSLPVFFYSATEFYISAWKSLRHNFLNIDAPIVLAIWVTFGRSLYEIFSGTGSGYLDSMSGIVFFMLIGRVLQNKTYEQLSFERDYTSYFPIAVTRINKQNGEESVALPSIALNDTLLIHNEELIPADGIITRGKPLIDYSFVTGESVPVQKEIGEIVYAGGRQVGGNMEILVIKEVSQSYLTGLWNKEELKKDKPYEEQSFVHLLSRYFTVILFIIAFSAAVYWYFADAGKIWNTVTAVLIVACPCALLLSNTFTNGNVLRILGRNNFYLRNAQTIEEMATADVIVFDKTGTLTYNNFQKIVYEGKLLSAHMQKKIGALAAQSTHPLSKAITQWAGKDATIEIAGFIETPSMGIAAIVDGTSMALGSLAFIDAKETQGNNTGTTVFLSCEGELLGKFTLQNTYRESVESLMPLLQKHHQLVVLSGDNEAERNNLLQLLGPQATILFKQMPEDKLNYIQSLQQKGKKVIMIGDGLNDAGALKQANAGIAITENTNNFTPASDAIMEAAMLPSLYKFIHLCRANKQIVYAAFVISILYNIVGISFAVMGLLSPMVAAILMPCSSISIVLITFGFTNIAGWRLKLK
ncbi:heavy metal translocating P-type ATPase [Limnovirga soli]|uniref:HAD-IC family P-type ATPase n=1 Tax=Limnovirga soli TaxID=2656915 RepID=A0A8J8JV66_9BACT|nr:heavy metal translocating P-type ATPase metal-binding domain-containing protein [Limnovirga soli]NNV53901.1 HAD-IC family P-type ATPase [Limnovirga soli]